MKNLFVFLVVKFSVSVYTLHRYSRFCTHSHLNTSTRKIYNIFLQFVSIFLKQIYANFFVVLFVAAFKRVILHIASFRISTYICRKFIYKNKQRHEGTSEQASTLILHATFYFIQRENILLSFSCKSVQFIVYLYYFVYTESIIIIKCLL